MRFEFDGESLVLDGVFQDRDGVIAMRERVEVGGGIGTNLSDSCLGRVGFSIIAEGGPPTSHANWLSYMAR